MGALAAALPMRVMGEDDRRAMVAIYRDGVLAEAAATDDDLDRAVATLIRHSDWWPTLRQLLEADLCFQNCHQILDRARLEECHQSQFSLRMKPVLSAAVDMQRC